MADVQKAKGAIQINNHLFEAMIEAEFSAPQIRIVMAILRLTYGWNGLGVRMKESDLAKLCGGAGINAVRAGGAWRVALDRLIQNGVVISLATERRGVFVWGVNKDFETWKNYSSPTSKLVARWSAKPDNRREDGRRVKEEIEVIRAREGKAAEAVNDEDTEDTPSIEGTTSGPDSGPGIGPEKERSPENEWPVHGRLSGPYTGQIDEAKSLFGETCEVSKDMKDSNTVVSTDHSTKEAVSVVPPTPPTAAELPIDDVSAFARSIASAINLSTRDRFGEQVWIVKWDSATQLAADLMRTGVTRETVWKAVAAKVGTFTEPPRKSANYYSGCILDAHREAEQRQFDEQESKGERGQSAPTSIASLLSRRTQAESDRRAADALKDQYDAERRAAAEAWSSDPANAGALRIIAVKAKLEMGADADGAMGEMALAATVRLACAKRAGFPEFDAWRSQPPPEQEPAEESPNPGVTLPAH